MFHHLLCDLVSSHCSYYIDRTDDLVDLTLAAFLYVGEIEPDSAVQPIGESLHSVHTLTHTHPSETTWVSRYQSGFY